MYSKQGALIQQFYEALEPRAADAMFALLGQCQHDLEHRGTLAILKTQTEGASGAVLTVANYPIPPDNYTTNYPSNGLAAEFFGKVRFRGVAEFDQPQIGAGADALPAGAVILWAGAIGSIPSGWALMDGVANSVGNGGSGINLTGIPYPYISGDPTFGTLGASVSLGFAATISGNGETTSLSIVNGTTGITVSTPGLSHTPAGGVTTIQTEFCIFDIDDTGDEFDGVDNNANYRNDESPQDKLTTQGHRHDITMSNVTDGIADHAAASCSVTDVGHGHTGTVSNNSIASGLSIGTPSTLRPAGTVLAYIEKLAA